VRENSFLYHFNEKNKQALKLLETSLESAVFLLLPCKEVSIPFFYFLGSLTVRDRFPLSNLIALCPSLFIFAQIYIVNQGFGTSAA